MARANSWTPAEEAWLRGSYPTLHMDELEREHAELFPDAPVRTRKALNSRAKKLGLLKADGFVRNPKTMWTPEKDAWFRAFVPGHSESEISAEHERLFGTPLTEGQIGNRKTKLGVKSGTVGGRFEKGCAGGFSSEEHRRRFMEAGKRTRFKKGNMPHNAVGKPVGIERVNADGYVEVKVAERKLDPRSAHDNWRPKHHIVYEQAHGEVPPGCNIVFADKDKRNFDPSNLVAVPRGVWSVISRKGLKYWDAESLRACMLVAQVDMARSRAERSPRACKRCGAEFAPRFKAQRTCDACLGR